MFNKNHVGNKTHYIGLDGLKRVHIRVPWNRRVRRLKLFKKYFKEIYDSQHVAVHILT